MKIQIHLYAGLRSYLPDGNGAGNVDVAEGATVSEVLAGLGVPLDKPKILLVNGRHVEMDSGLAEGDLLAVFPPVAGG